MEYRRFFNGLVSSGVAYSHFARSLSPPANTVPKGTTFVMDEASSFPPKRGSDASYTRPPKRRGENRDAYRARLREAGVL